MNETCREIVYVEMLNVKINGMMYCVKKQHSNYKYDLK